MFEALMMMRIQHVESNPMPITDSEAREFLDRYQLELESLVAGKRDDQQSMASSIGVEVVQSTGDELRLTIRNYHWVSHGFIFDLVHRLDEPTSQFCEDTRAQPEGVHYARTQFPNWYLRREVY